MNRGRHKKKDSIKKLMHRIKINPYWTPQVNAYKNGKLEYTWYPVLGNCNEKDIKNWLNILKNGYQYEKLIINNLTIIL